MLSRKKEWGFTLVEVMIALVISGLAMAGIFRGYVSIVVANETQESLIELNQNMRIVLQKMTDDIQMAGYNPQKVKVTPGSAPIGITTATATAITFRGDFNDDGDPADIETITYQLGGTDGDELQRVRTDPPAAPDTTTLMEDVEVLNFVYLDKFGATPVANPDDIRLVQIALVGRATNEDPTYNDDNTFLNLQAVALTRNSDDAAYPRNDMFHRRLLTMEVKCRNNRE